MNGDGDLLDLVVQMHVFGTSEVVNTGLAYMHSPRIGSGVFAISILESGQGADLNGDGDQLDKVLHIFDFATQRMTNVALAMIVPSFVQDGDHLLFRVDEQEQEQDLDGDGTQVDDVVFSMDLSDGSIWNTRQEGFELSLEGRTAAFLVREHDEADLNGDGDALDEVVFWLDLERRVVHNLGLASHFVDTGEDLVAFDLHESSQGEDYTGDGDTWDWVAMVYDVRSGELINLQAHVHDMIATGRRVAYTASEPYGDGPPDYNEDGDSGDWVAHLYEVGAGPPINAKLASATSFNPSALDSGGFVFFVYEVHQGASDLNGDGDAGDKVTHMLVTRPRVPAVPRDERGSSATR